MWGICNFHFQQRNCANMHCKSVAHMEGYVLLWLLVNKLVSNAHMWFNTLPNRATQEILLIECLTCLKLRLGWGKNKVLAQGFNTLLLWSYQIVLLLALSNLGFIFVYHKSSTLAFKSRFLLQNDSWICKWVLQNSQYIFLTQIWFGECN